MTAPIRVAVGVVAYRDPHSLGRLLDSVIGFDEVLVANVTADPEVDAVCRERDVTVLRIDGNVGYAAAVNRLADAVLSDRLLFTNDDVVLGTGAAEACRAVRGAVAVPRITDGQRIVRSVRAIPTVRAFLLEWVLLPDVGPRVGVVQKWRLPEHTERVQAATAAAVLCDVDVLRRVPLPEDYFLYWEELDWFWRLADDEVRVVYAPDLMVWRRGGRDEIGTSKWRLMGRNLVVLGRRRYGRRGAVVYFLITVLWLIRLSITDLLSAQRAQRWRARRAALWGAIDALRVHR